MVRSNSAAISARLRWIAGTRMCDCSSSPSCTISSARSVSIAVDPAQLERLVEPDLVGGQRLDLDHLLGAVVARDAGDDRVRLGAVARPVHDAAARLHRLLQPLELLGQRRHRARLDRRAGVAQRLPVVELADRVGALDADRRRRLAEVAAQLRVGERRLRGRAGKPAPLIPGPPGSRRSASRARRRAGARGRRRCASGRTCRPRCRPRRACRARRAACRRASPSTCRRS